jgi:hypothetical protein
LLKGWNERGFDYAKDLLLLEFASPSFLTFVGRRSAVGFIGVRTSDLADRIMPKLGICISPFMGLTFARLAEFAQESEDAGIEGIFIPEGQE